jgi:hypothetical protein
VVAQKRYTRAVRLLSELRRNGRDARLVVAGSISSAEGEACARTALAES